MSCTEFRLVVSVASPDGRVVRNAPLYRVRPKGLRPVRVRRRRLPSRGCASNCCARSISLVSTSSTSSHMTGVPSKPTSSSPNTRPGCCGMDGASNTCTTSTRSGPAGRSVCRRPHSGLMDDPAHLSPGSTPGSVVPRARRRDAPDDSGVLVPRCEPGGAALLQFAVVQTGVVATPQASCRHGNAR